MENKWAIEKKEGKYIFEGRGILSIFFDNVIIHKTNKSISFIYKDEVIASLQFGTHSILPMHLYSDLVYLKDTEL